MRRNLIWRLLAAITFLPVLLFLMHEGGWAYSALVFVIVTIGAWEWWRLGKSYTGGTDLVLIIAGVLGTLQGGLDPRPERLAIFLAIFLMLSFLIFLRHSDGRAGLRSGHLALGMLYVGLFPSFLIRIRGLPVGWEALLLTYGVVFICDTGAYGAGRAFGRHPLWPRISPRKTWEGAIGGLVGALAASLVGWLWFAEFLSPISAVGLGLIVGTLGQAGDLVESLWKREAGIKDTSRLIPGHGGVLDRFDNLHFVAPILYVYFTLCT